MEARAVGLRWRWPLPATPMSWAALPLDRARTWLGTFGPTRPYAGPTKGIPCDEGSRPEKVQGKAPAEDYDSGRTAKGYFCNARLVSSFGETGGYRVERYVDKAGHECAYWDSTLLWPHNAPGPIGGAGRLRVGHESSRGTRSHRHPPDSGDASPHESVRLNQKRGLLVADMGYPRGTRFIDVFDVTEDCRHPVLQSSTALGIIGHEGGFSPDGQTFYVASLYGHTLTAVDPRIRRSPRSCGPPPTTNPTASRSATTATVSTSPRVLSKTVATSRA